MEAKDSPCNSVKGDLLRELHVPTHALVFLLVDHHLAVRGLDYAVLRVDDRHFLVAPHPVPHLVEASARFLIGRTLHFRQEALCGGRNNFSSG